jgi:hypothetical protein
VPFNGPSLKEAFYPSAVVIVLAMSCQAFCGLQIKFAKKSACCGYTLVATWPTWRRAASPEAATEESVSVKATYSTPMLHVMEVERSLAFYELLGFVTVDTDDGKPLGWARMHS